MKSEPNLNLGEQVKPKKSMRVETWGILHIGRDTCQIYYDYSVKRQRLIH